METSNAEKGEPQLPDPGKGFVDTCLESPTHYQVLLLTHPSSFPPSVCSCIYLKVPKAYEAPDSAPGSGDTRVNDHRPCLQAVRACSLVKLHSGESRWRVSTDPPLGLPSTLGMFPGVCPEKLLLPQGNIFCFLPGKHLEHSTPSRLLASTLPFSLQGAPSPISLLSSLGSTHSQLETMTHAPPTAHLQPLRKHTCHQPHSALIQPAL